MNNSWMGHAKEVLHKLVESQVVERMEEYTRALK